MPERSQHRESEGQDGRSERPALEAWAAPTFRRERIWETGIDLD
jgi:hypothetical protein